MYVHKSSGDVDIGHASTFIRSIVKHVHKTVYDVTRSNSTDEPRRTTTASTSERRATRAMRSFVILMRYE